MNLCDRITVTSTVRLCCGNVHIPCIVLLLYCTLLLLSTVPVDCKSNRAQFFHAQVRCSVIGGVNEKLGAYINDDYLVNAERNEKDRFLHKR